MCLTSVYSVMYRARVPAFRLPVCCISVALLSTAVFTVLTTFVQEVEKRNPGAIAEIREMKYLKEAAQ